MIALNLILFQSNGNDQYIEISMDCADGPNPAAVPFVSDDNGASDGSVPIDAVNFVNKYEHCTTEFFNDQIPLEKWLSDDVLATDGQQCSDDMDCTSLFDQDWRAELNQLQGYVNIISSKYKFNEVSEREFEISGVRQLILETDGISGFPVGTEIKNEFTQTVSFNADGKVTRVKMGTAGLVRELCNWGLERLGTYGLAKNNPVQKTIDYTNDGNNNYKIVINEESLFFIGLIAVLLILSLIICTISTWKYNADNKVVSF